MSGFAKREGKDDLLMYTLIPTVFSLFFLPLSFFLSVLFTLGCLLPSCRGLFFSLGYFPFWIPLSLGASLSLSASLRFLLLSYHGFLPLSASPPPPQFSSMATSSFYSELIQWDFSLLPLGLHQLILACCGHSFSTTHQPFDCPATTSTQNTFAAPLLISWQNSLLFVLAIYLYL